LPIQCVCRKCGKTYSNQEYEQSKFCISCGSFLLRSFRSECSAFTSSKKGFCNQDAFSKPDATEFDGSLKEKLALTKAAESLRQRVVRSRDYEVVSETEKEKKPPASSAVENWIWSSEYYEALKLEKALIKQYEGKKLEESIAGKVVSNQQGECYSISASCISNFKKATYQESRRMIISDLKGLPGIGPAREQTLSGKNLLMNS
jgi:predicted  nucleic acid-binding Zn-ribbon protein